MKAKYLLIGALAILSFACEEDWLKPNPMSIFVPENIYVDKSGMDAVLLTLRKNLRNEFYGSPSMLTSEYISSDLGVAGNKESAATHNFDIQVTPTGTGSYNFFNYWNTAYDQIRNSNVVISRIEKPVWKTEKDKNEILAEALFHRAYWYYRLIHQFGDVPFLNQEYTIPKIDFYTHSRQTILDKIQTDLEFSVLWLPEVVDPGKVNRASGFFLLTKVYLAKNLYDNAIASASVIISDARYKLMTNRFGVVAANSKFNVIWDLHQKENKSSDVNTEKILVVQDKYGFPEAEVAGGTTSMRNYVPAWWHASYIKDPSGKQGCTDAAFNFQMISFGRGVAYQRASNYYNYEIWRDPNDLRHNQDTNWMPKSKILYNNPKSAYYGKPVNIRYTNAQDTFQAYFPWPQYKVYVQDEERLDRPYGGHSDWYLFRLAEVYLLRAEAYFWKNQLPEAAADLNIVRQRSRALPVDATSITIDYILDERARELYAEEPRKTELTRIAFMMAEKGLEGYSMGNFSEKNFWYDRVTAKNLYNKGIVWGLNLYIIKPYHVLWPVPQSAIDSNVGGRINQNMGYPGTEKNISPKTEIMEND